VVLVLDRDYDWFCIFSGVPDDTRAGAGGSGLIPCLGALTGCWCVRGNTSAVQRRGHDQAMMIFSRRWLDDDDPHAEYKLGSVEETVLNGRCGFIGESVNLRLLREDDYSAVYSNCTTVQVRGGKSSPAGDINYVVIICTRYGLR